MRKFIAFGPALVVLIATLVTLVAAPAAVRLIGYASTDAQIQLARHELDQENILKQIDKAVRNIADAVEPSVVHIGVQGPQGQRMRGAVQGSGWVFDKAGHIVTNSHVVSGGGKIFVQFNDGRAADAELVGQDQITDIAVLRVTATEGMFPIERATGLAMHQGDRVYAFGSPFGFKFSMSEGIVSGLGRDPNTILGQDGRGGMLNQGYTNFIQTDAAVNPGNSGGPLVNVDGKLVGMNVAIATAPTASAEGGQSAGISFAIPLATIERVVEQIVSGNVVARGYLGIGRPGNDEQNDAFLNSLGYHGRGVVVTNVEPGSPAETGGMLANDVIVKLDDQAITGVPLLRSVIANNAPGDKVNVEVWRAGETKKLVVELGRIITETEKRDALIAVARFGILDVGETRDGKVLVTEVRMPSLAYQGGFRPNMQIVAVNGTTVNSLEAFGTALASEGLQQGRELKVTIDPGDGQRKELRITSR
jgi:serine protease Do